LLFSLYEQIKNFFEFIKIQRDYFTKYSQKIEHEKLGFEEVEKKLKERFNRDYEIEALPQAQDLTFLFKNNTFNEEYKSYICHLSFTISSEKLAEHNNRFYFVPFINFLLQDSNNLVSNA